MGAPQRGVRPEERPTYAGYRGEGLERLFMPEPDPEHLVRQGAFKGEEIAVRFKRQDETQFPLMKSQFRWINGYP